MLEKEKLGQLLRLMRPQHYIKNVLIFCAVFFSAKLYDGVSLQASTYMFLSFCIVASAVYVLNDLIDISSDKQHPLKKYRPLACGKVDKREAIVLLCMLLSTGLISTYLFDKETFYLVSFYFILNVCYTLVLKHYAILDVVIISCGFVIRLFVGAAVTSVKLSNWIIIMTFLLALFIVLAKRRADVIHFNTTGDKIRKSLDGYNLKFVDIAMIASALIITLTYIAYTLTSKSDAAWANDNLYVTTLFVVFGLIRYLKLTLIDNKSDSPTDLFLHDKFTQFNLLGWILSFYWIIYS